MFSGVLSLISHEGGAQSGKGPAQTSGPTHKRESLSYQSSSSQSVCSRGVDGHPSDPPEVIISEPSLFAQRTSKDSRYPGFKLSGDLKAGVHDMLPPPPAKPAAPLAVLLSTALPKSTILTVCVLASIIRLAGFRSPCTTSWKWR